MTAIETKSVASDAVIDEMHRVFGAFRETNDERLTQIERRLSSDVVTEEKLTRIDAALDDTSKRMDRMLVERSRPAARRRTSREEPMSARAQGGVPFLHAHRRSHWPEGHGGEGAVGGSGPDGGYLVPVPAEREILQRMANISPIRAISTRA